MQKGDKIELFVEKLVFEGAGLAKRSDFTVFVEGAAPQENVLAEILSVNKSYAKAKVVEVLSPSKYRVKPFCAMANICGGCSWQHVAYEEQLCQKQKIVQETVKKIAGLDIEVKSTIASPQIKEYRHKIQYPIAQTSVSKRILAGYYKKNTHELVNIKHCPIQPIIIDEIIEFIRKKSGEYGICAYDEKQNRGLLRHVVFRHSVYNNEILVIFVINDVCLQKNIEKLSQAVFKEFEPVIGCLVNFNNKKTNTILGKVTQKVIGQDFYVEKLGNKFYHINAASFFQVNPKSAENILKTVKDMINAEVKNPSILDAYSGVGSFGIYLGDIACRVTCVEDFAPAANDALENVKLNNFDNFEILTGDAKVHLKNLMKQGKKYDVVIVDPPRKGLAFEAVETACALSKNLLVYVSCNPSTLARDLKIFSEKGMETLYIQPVDMFCHTYHIENIALLKKK